MSELAIIAVTACVSIVAIVAIVFGRNLQVRYRGGKNIDAELSVNGEVE